MNVWVFDELSIFKYSGQVTSLYIKISKHLTSKHRYKKFVLYLSCLEKDLNKIYKRNFNQFWQCRLRTDFFRLKCLGIGILWPNISFYIFFTHITKTSYEINFFLENIRLIFSFTLNSWSWFVIDYYFVLLHTLTEKLTFIGILRDTNKVHGHIRYKHTSK